MKVLNINVVADEAKRRGSINLSGATEAALLTEFQRNVVQKGSSIISMLLNDDALKAALLNVLQHDSDQQFDALKKAIMTTLNDLDVLAHFTTDNLNTDCTVEQLNDLTRHITNDQFKELRNERNVYVDSQRPNKS